MELPFFRSRSAGRNRGFALGILRSGSKGRCGRGSWVTEAVVEGSCHRIETEVWEVSHTEVVKALGLDEVMERMREGGP